MIVLVTGGRDWSDIVFVHRHMDRINGELGGITRLIHGAARGIDIMCRDWARSRGIEEKSYPADWDTHDNAAGAIRNGEMLKAEPGIERGIVFPGGTGTMDMARKLRKAGIERIFVNAEEDPLAELSRWG